MGGLPLEVGQFCSTVSDEVTFAKFEGSEGMSVRISGENMRPEETDQTFRGGSVRDGRRAPKGPRGLGWSGLGTTGARFESEIFFLTFSLSIGKKLLPKSRLDHQFE